MKHLLLVFILLFRLISASSQKEVKEKLFSRHLQDSVYYTVFVPVNPETESPMPVLYAIKYGMIEGSYVAAQLRYFQDARYPIPKTIVVTINADMDRTGFSYKTGLLSNTGSKFIACLKDEIIPAVEKKYRTSSFRTYLGHSYSASYAGYLMQYMPALFRGYILLATEEVGIEYSLPVTSREKRMPFHLDRDNLNFYNNTTTLCYAATGEGDESRRKKYAQDFLHLFHPFDSNHFFSKYDSIPGGDHTNILTMAIQPALEFIYQLYDPYYEPEPQTRRNAWESFSLAEKRVLDVYGFSPVKNFNWSQRFLQQAVADRDTASLIKLVAQFNTDSLKIYELLRVANLYATAGLTAKAKQYYQQIITKISARNASEISDLSSLAYTYEGMAFNVYKDSIAVAWKYLQKCIALAATPNKSGTGNIPDAYFTVGEFAVNNNYKVETGLQYIFKYLELRTDLNDAIHNPYYRIYYTIAQGYYLLNNRAKAREYLKRSLGFSDDFQPAKELMDKLK